MGSVLSSKRVNKRSLQKGTTYRISGKDEDLADKKISSKVSRSRKKKEKGTNAQALDLEDQEEVENSIYEDVKISNDGLSEADEDHHYDNVVPNSDSSGEMEGAGGYLKMPTAEERQHSLEAYGVDQADYCSGIVDAQEEKLHVYTALQLSRDHQSSTTDLADSEADKVHLSENTEAVEGQDDREDFNLANSYTYQNQNLGAETINNSLKRGDDDGNRIISPVEYLHKLDADSSQSKSSQQLKVLRDTLPGCTAKELSSLSAKPSSAPTAIYYRTSVERSLCKVQLAANYLVIVPFNSGTVGEFCGMMSEDYDGTCSIVDTDQCLFNQRIPLNSLTVPFIIQFGDINNFVTNVA